MASMGASTPGTAVVVAVAVGSWEAMREAVMVLIGSTIAYIIRWEVVDGYED